MANSAFSLSGGTAQTSAKGYINFSGITNTIRDSYNVSSFTDNGTGDYTVNWTNSFGSANYCIVARASSRNGFPNQAAQLVFTSAPTATTTQMTCWVWDSSTVADFDYVNAVVFRS